MVGLPERSTTVMASRGLLRLEMDVGADLCIVDSCSVHRNSRENETSFGALKLNE